jgi:flavin reductase (DIM6/NTAB) family NADH-FMN oxidoreductase RutF
MKKLPLQKIFTLLEPGPVVLVTTADGGKQNILTLAWTMVMDFTPRFAFLTGPWNFSYKALKKTKECVIAIPTVDLAKKAVQIGTCSGAEVNKFEKFKLTPLTAEKVSAPLIKECYANFA